MLGIDIMPAVLTDPGLDVLEERNYVVSENDHKIYNGNTPGTFIGRMLVTKNIP